MQKNFIQIFTIVLFFITFTTQAAVIKHIEITGLEIISRGTVLSYLPVEVGDDYDKKTSVQIIRTLYKTEFFKDIEVSQENQVLKIKVQENPHIKYFELLNYSDKVLNEESLQAIMKNMRLTQGSIFSSRQLEKFISQLEQSYIAKGYYGIKINKNIEIDAQNRVGVELDIQEGKVARINSMKIIGAKVYSEEKLLDLFEIGEADFAILNYFTQKDHYSKIALDAGIETMRSLYINEGYLDFKIDKIDTELDEDKRNISIKIRINEGLQYKIGTIQFTGNLLNQSTKELRRLFALKKGDIFKRKKVVEGVQAIVDVFTNQGYAFSNINAATIENKTTHIVDLNIDIKLNQKVYVNRITIEGNTRTQDQVIRREIGISEGGIYSSKEIDKSIKKIKRLGFFSDVKMDVSKIKGVKDKINLHFTVVETKTGQFSIGLSHSNSVGTSFNLGIQENNFLGTGNVLNANFSNSKAVKETAFYFSNPYFTEDNHSISYGIFTKSIDGSELDASSYKIDENGFSFGYGIPLSEDTRINADLRFSKFDVTCGTSFARDDEPEQCTSNDETEVKLGVGWSNNTLNDYRFPTEGQKNRVSVNVALPVADFRYYKFDASHKSYYPIDKDLTLNVKGIIGVADSYGSNDLPFFKRYYGGGASSIRGFDFNSLGQTYANGRVRGGKLSILTSASVISKLNFIDKSENMRISAFVDAGGIDSKLTEKGVDLKISAGLGFTWATPIGPLGFYAAKPLRERSGDKTKTFDFTIGTSF